MDWGFSIVALLAYALVAVLWYPRPTDLRTYIPHQPVFVCLFPHSRLFAYPRLRR